MYDPIATLTSMESTALLSKARILNLTDGHARMERSRAQEDIIARVPEFFEIADKIAFPDIEEVAYLSFLRSVGQYKAPVSQSTMATCYSSTTAMDIVARALQERVRKIAIMHPTFDNTVDLFRARDYDIYPIEEESFMRHGDITKLEDIPRDVSAIVLTTPNNPTGLLITRDQLTSIIETCSSRNAVLVLDVSFRGQDIRAQYDMYDVLTESNIEWIAIEDTGKLWPVHELKLGLLIWGRSTNLQLRRAFNEVLLSVSPVLLLLVAALAEDGANGGYEAMRRTLAMNRETMRHALLNTKFTLTDPDSRISVARVTLPPEHDSEHLYKELAQAGVHALPCGPFYWNNKSQGSRFLRFSLARPPRTVSMAASRIAELFKS